MIHQPIKAAFEGDPDAQQAVREVLNPVARYAEMTRRLAVGVPNEAAATKLRHEARELHGLIVARARSGGIVDHEMDTFWEEVQAQATAKYRRRIEIYALPQLQAPKPRSAHDPIAYELEVLIIAREERWKRAGERLAQKRTKLAAHRAAKVPA